jgi:hypothetical protein
VKHKLMPPGYAKREFQQPNMPELHPAKRMRAPGETQRVGK